MAPGGNEFDAPALEPQIACITVVYSLFLSQHRLELHCPLHVLYQHMSSQRQDTFFFLVLPSIPAAYTMFAHNTHSKLYF